MPRITLAVAALAIGTALLAWHFPARDSELDAELDAACPEGIQVDCIISSVTALAEKGHLEHGLAIVRLAYEKSPAFRPRCQLTMAKIGSNLAAAVPDHATLPLSPDITLCNYGLVQEYAYTSVMRGLSPEETARFCNRVGSTIGRDVPNASTECIRGIGRAAPFADESIHGDAERMITAAEAACAAVAAPGHAFLECVSGAYNMLARETVAGRFGLSVRKSDPMWLCAMRRSDLKPRCEGNWKWTLFGVPEGYDITRLQAPGIPAAYESLSEDFGKSGTEHASTIIWTIAYWQGQLATATTTDAPYEAHLHSCAQLPGSYRSDCIKGFAVGIAKHGWPGRKYEEVLGFCLKSASLLPDVPSYDCAAQAYVYLKGVHDPATHANACSRLLSSLAVSCDEFENVDY